MFKVDRKERKCLFERNCSGKKRSGKRRDKSDTFIVVFWLEVFIRKKLEEVWRA